MQTKNLSKALIIQIFSINIIIFLLFVGIFFGKFYNEMNLIEDKKRLLQNLISSKQSIETKGVSYSEFKELVGVYGSGSSYTASISKAISEDFYASHITNNSEGDFMSFFERKSVDIEKKKGSLDTTEKKEHIDNILPEYNPNLIGGEEKSFTDFKFINYVEALLYAFNLVTDSPIGVSDVTFLQEYSDTNEAQGEKRKENPDNIDANIYYIPLSLKLTGAKADVIDFLQFSEEVGNISLFNGQIQVLQNNEIKKTIPYGQSKNIFENQVFDIESITMTDYLDSEIAPSSQDIITYVKSTQSQEKFSFEVNLRFFVRGLPNYVLKNTTRDILSSYDELKKNISKRVKEVQKIEAKSSDIIYAINGIRTLEFDINLLDKTAKEIRTSLGKAENLRETYITAVGLQSKIHTIEKNLEKNNHILDIAKNK